MFKSISWQQFIIAVSVAAVCYYTVIIIIFYFRDIAARLKGGQVSASRLKERQSTRPARNLMGLIAPATPIKRKPVDQSSASAEDVVVQENANEPAADDVQSTPADELLQELGNLFEIMKEGKPSQESYVKNIKTLLSQYAHLIGPEDHKGIHQTISEELKTKHNVFLSTDVLDELWPKAAAKKINHSNK